MIKAESLSRTYGNVLAVNDVSFQIEHGEIVGLLGHNGAGKTTIMKMLTGYLEPSSGTINIDNLDITDSRLAIEQTIGYLPENCPVYPEMAVLDYLDYAASLRGVPEDKKVERIRYAIEKTRLREVAQQQIGTLSRGYRQRLGVAQAILNSPKILILDEPTNGLDPSQIQEMRSLIKELAENATILLSTHILQEVQAVCGRVIIIDRGKLALDASMSDLRKTDRLLVSTDGPPEKATRILQEVHEVLKVSSKETEGHYIHTLELAGSSASEVAPKVAAALVKNEMSLYLLQPQIRDLETIFREITTLSESKNGDEQQSVEVTEQSSKSTPGSKGDVPRDQANEIAPRTKASSNGDVAQKKQSAGTFNDSPSSTAGSDGAAADGSADDVASNRSADGAAAGGSTSGAGADVSGDGAGADVSADGAAANGSGDGAAANGSGDGAAAGGSGDGAAADGSTGGAATSGSADGAIAHGTTNGAALDESEEGGHANG